ncbi:MAG: motility associated factor glycosyltransferase family protein [Lachnospiraceae bacterium]|nr:motility associated factor glycosyltransferase family protein [Lachnospiraceae bacterium]
MAEEFIEEIYFYANTISKLRRVAAYLRVQDDLHGIKCLRDIIGDVQKLCEACLKDGYGEAESLKSQLLQIPHIQRDTILLADMLESTAIPIMERWMQSWAMIEQELDEAYVIESTESGFLTLKHTREERYLHSNRDPMDEAIQILQKQYDAEKSAYMIWGCGLGYHVYQLFLISKGAIPIRLYEPEPAVVQYALDFGVLSWIPREGLEIVTPVSVEEFLKERPGVGVFIHLPSLQILKEDSEKMRLQQQYIQLGSRWEGKAELEFNFYRNKEQKLPDISRLSSGYREKLKPEMVVIAGGPSVDHMIDRLREWQGKKTLIAVGTIFKRLMKEGIRPDYVAVMDPYETVYGQVEGVEDGIQEIPLLLNLLAYWKVARTYPGSIYTVCMGHDAVVENYAKENGYEIWESGGTVTAMAMEFAIRFGAGKIYLVGVDLAYPGGLSHASGTNEQRKVELSGLVEVPGVHGKRVYTNDTFSLYRQWIEYRIAQTPDITYINMSDVGAQIKGTLEGNKM